MKTEEIEVSLAKYQDGEQEVRSEYIKACMGNDDLFVDTKGFTVWDAEQICSIYYRKDRDSILEDPEGELTEAQKALPEQVQASLIKWKEEEVVRIAERKERSGSECYDCY